MHDYSPQFAEATRLIRKFFPESIGFVLEGVAVDWDSFIGAMMLGEYKVDHSCDPFRRHDAPLLGLAELGGLEGPEEVVYERLLKHTGVNPTGRAVVVPDATGSGGWSLEECPPFICHSRRVAERLFELTFFGQGRDSIFVFESGEAIVVDHDERLHWAKSRIRRWTEAQQDAV